eukprot:GEMP01036602.1.p1 GENE.GEMP01036602.1~~GEMP01036602.1.p1  ORF type:complete len:389 (+),score=66.51 GEMP01036602.1:80-1246(+)
MATLAYQEHLKRDSAANTLGINPIVDLDWMWIAEEASTAELPPEWQAIESDTGEIAYYKEATKLLVTSHPVMDKFKQLYDEQRAFMEKTRMHLGEHKVQSMVSQILNEVLNRCHRGLPPVTPELVEQLSLVLNIDASEQFSMCLQLRNMLEDLAESQYELAIMSKQSLDPIDFLGRIRKAVIRTCVTMKKDSIMMCQECEERSARVKCEQCKDFFCVTCFDKTHISGKRRNHTKQKVEQCVCDVCDLQEASTSSLESNERYCDDCLITKMELLSGHRMKVIKGLMCSECEAEQATRLCEDCCDLFCIECYLELHRKGKRRIHTPLTIDEDGQLKRADVRLPPEDVQHMIAKARFAGTGGPWVAFKDDQHSTYWYHFRDKIITRRSPYA